MILVKDPIGTQTHLHCRVRTEMLYYLLAFRQSSKQKTEVKSRKHCVWFLHQILHGRQVNLL